MRSGRGALRPPGGLLRAPSKEPPPGLLPSLSAGNGRGAPPRAPFRPCGGARSRPVALWGAPWVREALGELRPGAGAEVRAPGWEFSRLNFWGSPVWSWGVIGVFFLSFAGIWGCEAWTWPWLPLERCRMCSWLCRRTWSAPFGTAGDQRWGSVFYFLLLVKGFESSGVKRKYEE